MDTSSSDNSPDLNILLTINSTCDKTSQKGSHSKMSRHQTARSSHNHNSQREYYNSAIEVCGGEDKATLVPGRRIRECE